MRFGRTLLVLSAMVLAVVGCKSGETTATSNESSGPADGKKYRIGISLPSADHGWTAGAIWWAKEATKLYPDVEFDLQTAKDPSEQTSQIETMMAKNLDGLVVLATESAPLTPVAKEAHGRGILLVNVDRGFTEPVADVFIEGDNKAFGRKAAEWMAEKLNGNGNIVILEGIPCTVNTDRVTAAAEVFKKYPGIKILDQQSGKWNPEESLKVMETFLLKHPKIDAVWASDDDMAIGAEKAIKAAGREKEMWMLGGGGMKEVVKRIMDGDAMYPATITYPPSMTAVAVQKAVSILRDGKRSSIMKFMPRHMVIDVDVVEPTNAKDYYFPDSVY